MSCKGWIWRYKENQFINSKVEIVIQKRIRPLKRMSCKGDHSGPCMMHWTSEALGLYFSECQELPDLPDGVKDGDLLKLQGWWNEDEIVLFFENVEDEK